MSLEDLRRVKAEANGEIYLNPEQRKLLEVADTVEQEQDLEANQIRQQQQMQSGMFDTRPTGVDVYFLDRLIRVRLPPKKERIGLWITHEDVLEQISLINLDANEYRGLMREYQELEDLAAGEGNEKVLQSDINAFMVKIEAMKARSDLVEKGPRERTLWVMHKTQQESVVRLPEESSTRSGFLSIFRRK